MRHVVTSVEGRRAARKARKAIKRQGDAIRNALAYRGKSTKRGNEK